MSTKLVYFEGQIITAPGGSASARAVDYTAWPAGYETGFVIVSNQTDDVASLRTVNTAGVGGMTIPAGALQAFGPLGRGVDLWVYSAGTGNVHVDFNVVASEGR